MASIEQMIIAARNTQMSDSEREQQRQSFAYGNTNFENDQITRETVKRASQLLKGQVDDATQHGGRQ